MWKILYVFGTTTYYYGLLSSHLPPSSCSTHKSVAAGGFPGIFSRFLVKNQNALNYFRGGRCYVLRAYFHSSRAFLPSTRLNPTNTLTSVLKMTKSTTRRRPRALDAIVAAVLGGGQVTSGFVSHSTLSLSLLPPARSGGRSCHQHQGQQHRYLQQHRLGHGLLQAVTSSAKALRSSSSLAGALSPDNFSDHADGWNPIDGVEIGTVSLVGSGPGDPDLLTVAGLRELQSADLVIADRLVSKEILGLVRKSWSRW